MEKLAMNRNLKLIGCAVGVFVCYFYYGILQEKITRGQYGEGEEKEKFNCTLALVFVQCIINTVFAKILLHTVMKSGEDSTKSSYYGACSLTYLLAMVSSNKALKWVNYPTQVVGKSCKPIPVMILGVLLARKKYPLKKYFFIFMIVVGVCLFIYKDTGVSASPSTEITLGMGEILLLLSLTMDGLTGAIQEKMKEEHKPKPGHMMYSMNLWSVAYLAVALLLTGEGIEFISFVQRHRDIISHLLTFSVASALGQFFIFMTVADFGPLPCSIITTTRKFFTVLGSVIIFGNELITRQWIGTALVFAGLFLDAACGKSGAAAVKKKEE